MGLNGYFLIFIMVNINLKLENYRKQGKTVVIEGVWVDNKTYTLHKFYGCQIGQRERISLCKQILSSTMNTFAKLNTYHSHPKCDSKEWHVPTNYSYPKQQHAPGIIYTIVMQGHNNLHSCLIFEMHVIELQIHENL